MSCKSTTLTLCFVAYAALVWYADPMIFVIAVGLVVLMLPVAFGCLVALAYRMRRALPLGSVPKALRIFVLFFLLLGAGAPLNIWLKNRAVDEAKQYVLCIAPSLEAYREAHGSYPTDLRQLSSLPPPPRLIEMGAYSSDGKTYSFSLGVPGGMIDTWDYSSQLGKWILND